MVPSTLLTRPPRLHVAIIMDGNGRWATERGLSRAAGHRAGVEAVRRVVEAAPAHGIETLTLYAFSAANWGRPVGEVRELLGLLRDYLCSQTAHCVARGVRLSVVGRRDRLTPALRAAIAAAETTTGGGRTLHLRVALDYSARESILRAAQRALESAPAGATAGRTAGRAAPAIAPASASASRNESLSAAGFERLLAEVEGGGTPVAPVDLLIRSGGEQRLSDFLLWESAYAELVFTPAMWPDFTAGHLEAAVLEFGGRDRRFGGLPKRAAS